jgi:hypothetical protein
VALLAQVVARVPNQTLVELTNQKNVNATTYDATILQTACDDIEAEFVTYAGEDYDATVRRHVTLGVEGVLAKLRSWLPQNPESVNQAMTSWGDRVTAMSKTRSRNRFPATTSSRLTPTEEVTGSEEVRPWSDPESFDGIVPRAP